MNSGGAARLVLFALALPFAMVGFMFLCWPIASSAFIALGVESDVARVDVRAVYGGFNIGLAVFLVSCAIRNWTVHGLFASLFAYAGLATGRAVGFIADGPGGGVNAALFAGEVCGVVLSYVVLRVGQGFRGMQLIKQGMRYLLGIFFVLAGINHFVNPGFYTDIMPGYLPAHHALVLLSGVTEIIAGTLLFYGPLARLGAWGIVAMLVVFFAVHIHMIVHADRYASVPLWGLWLRLIFQFVLIAWAWWFTRPDKPAPEEANA